jgi:hypothetical protein
MTVGMYDRRTRDGRWDRRTVLQRGGEGDRGAARQRDDGGVE